jgi:hypothetical protein
MRIAAAGASIVAATQSGDTAIVWRAGDPALAELMRFEGGADVPLTVGDSGVSVLAVAAYQDRIVTGDLHAVEPELGLVDVAPATVRSLSARGASIFAATDVGLLASHDGGKSFAADLTPHAPANLTALCVHGDDVYVADATGGLWIRRSA